MLEGLVCILADPELCGSRDHGDEEVAKGNAGYNVVVADRDVAEKADMGSYHVDEENGERKGHAPLEPRSPFLYFLRARKETQPGGVLLIR